MRFTYYSIHPAMVFGNRIKTIVSKIFYILFFISCMLAVKSSKASKSTWTGSVNSSWNNASNWTSSNGGSRPPSSSDTVVIATVSNQPSLPHSSTALNTLIIQSGSIPIGNPSTNLTITNNMIINSGQLR